MGKNKCWRNLDDIIFRAIKFKQKKNKIYVYKGEETDDK